MRCPQCGYDNGAELKFCGQCGTRLALLCSGCGAHNSPGQKFCGECGARLASITAARPPSPDSYTPKHLAERILTSKAALEGERKQVTVLFADMKGSMELLADRDPEEARKILDPVLALMMEAVHRYEGTVNQVMGDGIMALFGAPIAHEDHAVRACYAALRMQESVRRHSEDVRCSHGIEVSIRVGLNSGDVVVRSIGSDLRMDYTAVGQTTHFAARMEQLATPGTVLMTADTLRLAEAYVAAKQLGPVAVKGVGAPVKVYEVIGVGPIHTRLGALAARKLNSFVGRHAEVDQLRRALDEASAGRGQVVAVVGEPGVGKSRLFHEFTRSHRARGWMVLETGSFSYWKATPYLPVIDLLKTYFGIAARDDHRSVREKVTRKLLTLNRSLVVTVPAILDLLDVPVEDTEWEALDPSQRRRRTLDAVHSLLLNESEVQPLLLVFEDLHWIDEESQALLDGVVEALPGARVLLLVNYRPEYEHRWSSKTYYTQLRLDPLQPETAEEFLRGLLGDHASLRQLSPLLIERTEGNPFFLEESVRTLVETRVLIGERGAYRLVTAMPSIQVPTTVQAVLAARIDRLPSDDKRLLQTASVIGTDLPFPLLQAVADVQEETLRRSLARLQAAEFLYESSPFPDVEYAFRHALTHDVAYASLLRERRRALHARIVEAIEHLYTDRRGEQVERLAHHALRGEIWEKALTYSRQAGSRAYARSGNREAVVSFELALVALSHLPECRETIEQAIDVRCDMRTALLLLGEYGRIFDYLREAAALAEALGDRRRLGVVCHHLAGYFVLTGDPDRAIEASRRTLEIAKALGDSALQVVTDHRLGMAYQNLGDYRRAVGCLKRNVEALRGDLIRERFGLVAPVSVLCRTRLVECLAELGEFATGSEIGQEGVQIVEALDHPASRVFASRGVGFLRLRKGELKDAISVLERSLLLCESCNLLQTLPIVASQLGYAYALSGKIADALSVLEQAVEQADAMRFLAEQSLRVSWLSEACLLAGRLDEAVEQAKRAFDLSRDHKERGNQAWILRLLGDLAFHRDPYEVETSEGHYSQALALATELGMRPLIAHCHLGLGKLYRRTGKREQAQEDLSTATTMYREMGMTHWLEKAESEMGP
jgi:class 3 adenylate cyclase/tetratricopeptide (TPR) repeat protein